MKKNLRLRRLSRNRTKKVKYWWYPYLDTFINIQNISNGQTASAWLKLDRDLWYKISIVRKNNKLSSYVNGIKE